VSWAPPATAEHQSPDKHIAARNALPPKRPATSPATPSNRLRRPDSHPVRGGTIAQLHSRTHAPATNGRLANMIAAPPPHTQQVLLPRDRREPHDQQQRQAPRTNSPSRPAMRSTNGPVSNANARRMSCGIRDQPPDASNPGKSNPAARTHHRPRYAQRYQNEDAVEIVKS